MKLGLYSTLAVDGIKKNKKIYLPYLLTSSLMVAVFYIMTFLAKSPTVSQMEGGSTTQVCLNLGTAVIGVFALIFLIYTNSFLMRRRKKEFGLYNMLGMNKKNLGRIMTLETFYCYLLSMVIGLVAGIAFSKLSELALLNLVNASINYKLSFDFQAMIFTVITFSAIYFLILCKNLLQIYRSKPIEMAKSESVGEKQPKANYLFGIGGILLLLAAYYIAFSIKQPIEALVWFFIAVIMVILGSYLLFISGSVMLCRVLQKNKNYYYQKNHFVSISSMAYRMKRNGAGLASICILLTMVLVTISSTASLYMGSEDSLNAQYPKEICNTISNYGYFEDYHVRNEALKNKTQGILAKENVIAEEVSTYYECNISGLRVTDGVDISMDPTMITVKDYDKITEVHMIDLAIYNEYTGSHETLEKGQVLACAVKTKKVEDHFVLGKNDFKVIKVIEPDALDFYESSEASIYGNIFLIVPDLSTVLKDYASYKEANGSSMILNRWHYDFNMTGSLKEKKEIVKKLESGLDGYLENEGVYKSWSSNFDCKEAQVGDFYGTFGGLFFIGILLSILFLIAAVLIIYYKQVTEGYEDQSRFEIMQKVGMTKEDIRATINSQMFTVFLLPILFAAIHTACAFPVVRKLLMLFALFNTPLLVSTTVISILICAIFYLIVYRLTSNVYYEIVK